MAGFFYQLSSREIYSRWKVLLKLFQNVSWFESLICVSTGKAGLGWNLWKGEQFARLTLMTGWDLFFNPGMKVSGVHIFSSQPYHSWSSPSETALVLELGTLSPSPFLNKLYQISSVQFSCWSHVRNLLFFMAKCLSQNAIGAFWTHEILFNRGEYHYIIIHSLPLIKNKCYAQRPTTNVTIWTAQWVLVSLCFKVH